MTAPAAPQSSLTHADRCDRCGAQAFVRVVVPVGEGVGELLFCGHHHRENADKLAAVALHTEDETGTINSRPSPSAY